MKTNVYSRSNFTTHEGAPAKRINAEQQLRRSLMACMLWEKTFYEDGVSVAERIKSLVPEVNPAVAIGLTIEAREAMKLRHAPLLIVREMARIPMHRRVVAGLLERVIQRADELAEFVSLYWMDDDTQPLSAQVKRGLALAFRKFDAYSLAKYNQEGKVKLRDVLFLCHAKPKDVEQDHLWKRLIGNFCENCWKLNPERPPENGKRDNRVCTCGNFQEAKLGIPDTWEVALSAGKDKKETWERLINENKLGALALLRNLRNMAGVGVRESVVLAALDRMKVERVLPFRFISAAHYVPQWESSLEQAMFKCIEGQKKLPGRTILLVDVSGSMDKPISDKSDLMRYDAANGLAILARELCDNVAIFSFSNHIIRIPDRHGFALRDAIANSQGHGNTYLGAAIDTINHLDEHYDRLIVLTDEQSHDPVPNPKTKGYMINVASYQNGVGYGAWTHVDGFSEAVFDYICELESSADE